MLPTPIQTLSRRLRPSLFLLLSIPLLLLGSCDSHELDEYGGYYDEKLGKYRYVKPIKRGIDQSELRAKQPRPNESQTISGVIKRIENDYKEIWLFIKDRQSYQMLAEVLAKGNRDDKNQLLRIQLEYVAPMASINFSGNQKREWVSYLDQLIKHELLNKKINVTIRFLAKAKKLTGIAYVVIQTDQGRALRNVNRWMVNTGLSYLIYDPRDENPPKDFIQAQVLAKKQRAGVWNYQ